MEPYLELEKKWAEFNNLDSTRMVCCSSGTSALHLALEAFRLPLGSEVIVPDYTMIACPRAVTLAGLTPVFVDCGLGLLTDPNLCRQAIKDARWEPWPGEPLWKAGRDIRVLMAVHIYGRKVNLDAMFGPGFDVPMLIIEDLAEAHGVKPHPQTDAACWSFYRNKIVAGEEGGAVWFRDPEHAALARQLRNLGFTDAHDFMHLPRGHNYRMSNAHASLILKNFEPTYFVTDGPLVDMNRRNRRRIERWMGQACPNEWKMPPRDSPWVYDLRIRGMTAEKQGKVVRALNTIGIAARHGFKPCSSQEEYRNCRRVTGPQNLVKVVKDGQHVCDYTESNAEMLAREIIYLPLTPGAMTKDRVAEAFRIIKQVVG